MKRLLILFFVFLILSVISCTQCTNCEYYYVLPSSLDTLSGSDEFCGSNKLVKDFEDYFEQDIQTKAGLAGTAAVITCVRSSKPQ